MISSLIYYQFLCFSFSFHFFAYIFPSQNGKKLAFVVGNLILIVTTAQSFQTTNDFVSTQIDVHYTKDKKKIYMHNV